MIKIIASIMLVVFIGFVNAQETNSLKLWYKSPAAKWNEALPAGNGRLGVMVFGNPAYERIQLHEGSLWALRKGRSCD